MSKNTYPGGYYATKERKRAELADIKNKTDEYSDKLNLKAAKTAKWAKEVENCVKMASKVAENIGNPCAEVVLDSIPDSASTPNPNAAFRRQKSKKSGRASVYRHIATAEARAKKIGSLYHNPGPGKYWDPRAEEWKTIGKTPSAKPIDPSADPLSEDDSLWGDIPDNDEDLGVEEEDESAIWDIEETEWGKLVNEKKHNQD